GVAPGDHVALVMANYPEYLAVKFAIARAGAVCVPVNYLFRRDELGYVLGQSDATVLVTMDRFRGLDYVGALDELAPGWAQPGGGSGSRCRCTTSSGTWRRRWPCSSPVAGSSPSPSSTRSPPSRGSSGTGPTR